MYLSSPCRTYLAYSMESTNSLSLDRPSYLPHLLNCLWPSQRESEMY